MALSASRPYMETLKIVSKSIDEHQNVREWLGNRLANTQRGYGLHLIHFSELMHITPEQFQTMDKKAARDLAWQYICSYSGRPSVQINAMACLKSFFRNRLLKVGETVYKTMYAFRNHEQCICGTCVENSYVVKVNDSAS